MFYKVYIMFTEKAKMPCKGCILLPVCKVKFVTELNTNKFYGVAMDKLKNTCSLFGEYYRKEDCEILMYNIDKLFIYNIDID